LTRKAWATEATEATEALAFARRFNKSIGVAYHTFLWRMIIID